MKALGIANIPLQKKKNGSVIMSAVIVCR